MRSRLVICNNDYPFLLLTEGTTEEDARNLCILFMTYDKENLEVIERYQHITKSIPYRVYYHVKDVIVQ